MAGAGGRIGRRRPAAAGARAAQRKRSRMRGSVLARSAFVAALALAAAGGLSGSSHPAAAAGSPHVLFGAYVNHAYPNQDRRQQLATLERFLGRTLAIDHLGFFSWSGSLPATT